MSEAGFRSPAHKHVVEVLSRLDRAFLADAQCYFGGGTRIVLELGEYRESKDIDFLCSSQAGYRRLRETVSEHSLGAIVAGELSLAREVRADQYGIRTFLESDAIKIKFEIVREARITLDCEDIAALPVPASEGATASRRNSWRTPIVASTPRRFPAISWTSRS